MKWKISVLPSVASIISESVARISIIFEKQSRVFKLFPFSVFVIRGKNVQMSLFLQIAAEIFQTSEFLIKILIKIHLGIFEILKL